MSQALPARPNLDWLRKTAKQELHELRKTNPDAKLAAYAKREGWTVLPLKRSSIRDARKKVKREARAVRRSR